MKEILREAKLAVKEISDKLYKTRLVDIENKPIINAFASLSLVKNAKEYNRNIPRRLYFLSTLVGIIYMIVFPTMWIFDMLPKGADEGLTQVVRGFLLIPYSYLIYVFLLFILVKAKNYLLGYIFAWTNIFLQALIFIEVFLFPEKKISFVNAFFEPIDMFLKNYWNFLPF